MRKLQLIADSTISGILFYKDSIIYFYESDELEIAYLSKEIKIGYYRFAPPFVSFYENGNVEECFLADEFKINNIICPKNTNIIYNENTRLKLISSLSSDINISCSNINISNIPKLSKIYFYDTEKLKVKTIVLSEKTKIKNKYYNPGFIEISQFGEIESYKKMYTN